VNQQQNHALHTAGPQKKGVKNCFAFEAFAKQFLM